MANPEDLGRYRLKRLLGRGALGEVWEASDLEQQGNKVAVKIMHAADDELALARSHFAREARLASLMRHPNVVAVHDAGEAAGTSFMVMDMVEGKSLRTFIKDDKVTMAERLRWIRQIGDGLSAMHRAGVVHRDVKPENVIVREDRSVCLVDLGIAKWVKFDLGGLRLNEQNEIEADDPDAEKEAPGPPEYIPPETTERQLYDELGDQYAWGVLAYEVITGAPPSLEGDSPPLTARDDVPIEVAKAIDKARSPARNDRWDGMELVLDEIVDKTASKRPSKGPPQDDFDGPDTEPRGETITSAPPAQRPSNTSADDDSKSGSASLKSTALEPSTSGAAAFPEKKGVSPVIYGVLAIVVFLVVAIALALR